VTRLAAFLSESTNNALVDGQSAIPNGTGAPGDVRGFDEGSEGEWAGGMALVASLIMKYSNVMSN